MPSVCQQGDDRAQEFFEVACAFEQRKLRDFARLCKTAKHGGRRDHGTGFVLPPMRAVAASEFSNAHVGLLARRL